MSNSILKACIILIGMTVLSSCNNEKRQYLNSFEDFVVNIESNYQSYTFDDWKRSFDTFKVYEEEYEQYKDKMTADDESFVSSLEERYFTVLKRAPRNMLRDLYPTISTLLGEEGQNWVNQFESHLRDLGDDFRDLMDMIGD